MLLYTYNVCTMYSARTFKMILPNRYTHNTCIAFRGELTSVLHTGVNNIFFCYIAISDDISTHADFQVDGYHGC